jgi:acetoin utilization deacetylase AcuC-like enzyme
MTIFPGQPMKIVYSERYHIDIGAHVFPTIKYVRVRERLLALGIAGPEDVVEPAPATWDDLGLVHTPDYIDKVRHGRLSLEEIAQMEIPWSEGIVDGFRLMVGGTMLAARLAMGVPGCGRDPSAAAPGGGERASGDARPATAPRRFDIAVHVGGGFHHAHSNHGEGFCMFNDVAVATRRLKRDEVLARAAIVDCDVHAGNGTAAIFAGEPWVFTFSMHQLHNYPALKPPGSLDIALDDRTTDEEYLDELREALPRVFASRPQVVFYLAGADPYEGDQLGGLRLTLKGLRARDRLVFEAARAAGVPVAVTLAGGYARHVEDTVRIHVATVEEALAVLHRPGADAAGER